MRSRFLCSVFGLLFICLGLSAQSLQVVDAEGHSNTLSGAQFAERPRVTINLREHDRPVQFEGLPLATLLSSTGIQLGDKLRGPRLTEALLVEASDGYRSSLR